MPRLAPRRPLAVAAAALAATGTAAAVAAPSPPELQNRIAGVNRHEQTLRSSVQSDTAQAQAFEARLADLRVRLDALQTSFAIEQRQLDQLQEQLRGARARLAALQARLVHDRAALRTQLVAAYESPPPDITTVVLDSHGFADLLERVDVLRRIQGENVRTIIGVRTARIAVARQTARLADLEGRQQRITAAVLVQRQEVAALRNRLASRRLVIARDRAGKNAQLSALDSHRQSLEHQLSQAQGATSGGLLAHDGAYGFFPYPGTNYAVGNEPQIASRLNAMAKALHLHLIGVSGYRSPQHSVEVGGFADDPHTQGAASDTPGVEGVPEATLQQYGLTRPFGGAAEADHIQLG